MGDLLQRVYDWYILVPREFCRELMCPRGFDPLTDERVEAAEQRQRERMRAKYDRVIAARSK